MELPVGTVTMVFTDIEGSTRLLQKLGPDQYVRALEDHRRLLRQTFAAHDAVEVEMQGDSFHFAFTEARAAVLAAAEAQRALAEHGWEDEPILVRIGVHSGVPVVSGALYAGLDVHRAARVMSAGHGGQVLVSERTRELVGDAIELRSLGEHRLKDLLEPVRIYQLGGREFPPLRSLYRTNLPVPPTPFLGRGQELGELRRLLGEGSVRLLTLTGPGGAGKTRLAMQGAAESAESFPDGIYWVGVAPLSDPDLVVPAIAQALGATGELADHIGNQRLLVVLDNLEQLVDAAVSLGELLAACGGLTLLATSREPLHLSSEREYPVPPLADDDAISLFRERARAIGVELPASGEIAAICRRLDQLPLAIELAAARVKLLSPAGLLERLEDRLPLLTGGPRDLPQRQQTLRATIQWSHDLLSNGERPLFARLAVFAGGCTLAAAADVCEADIDTLQSLLDKNLLRRSGERYWMLETIREYAAEQLATTGDADRIRGRHAEYYGNLAEQARSGLRAERPAWLERLAVEESNVRAALTWLEARGESMAVLAIVSGIHLFLDTRGAWLEGRRWLEPALEQTRAERSRLRGQALMTASSFSWCLGELGAARAWGEEGLAIFRELDDPDLVGRALATLAVVATTLGEIDEARRLGEEAIVYLRQTGNKLNLATVMNNLGYLAIADGDHDRAAELLEESLALYREVGRDDAQAHFNVALLRFRTGRYSEATQAARESLRSSVADGDARTTIYVLILLASVANRQGRCQASATLLGAAEAERLRTGLALEQVEGALHEQTVEEVRAALGADRAEAALADGSSLSLSEAAALALNDEAMQRRVDELLADQSEGPRRAELLAVPDPERAS